MTLLSAFFSFVVYRLGIAGIIVNLLPNATNLPEENASSVYDYYSLRTYRAKGTEDPDIVLVNISDCTREQIGKIVSTVDRAGAKVIGLDAYFQQPKPNDTLSLIKPLADSKKTILGIGFSVDDTGAYNLLHSYFAEGFSIPQGMTNLYQQGRKISTSISINNDVYPSFSWAVAKAWNSELGDWRFSDQYVNYMDFWYDSQYMPYDAKKLLEDQEEYYEDFKEVVNGKIALLGVISEHEDLHFIPSGQLIPGMLIQAYAISTIIHDKCIRAIPEGILWGCSIVLCFIITVLLYYFERKKIRYSSIIFKSVEVIMMIGLLYAFLGIFRMGWFIDFSPYFIIFAFQLFFSSIINAKKSVE